MVREIPRCRNCGLADAALKAFEPCRLCSRIYVAPSRLTNEVPSYDRSTERPRIGLATLLIVLVPGVDVMVMIGVAIAAGVRRTAKLVARR